MLEVCPELKELHVVIWTRTHRLAFLEACMSDDFLIWKAERCPQLWKLVISETDFLYVNEARLNTTGKGLVVRSKTPLLTSIALKQTHCMMKLLIA